MSVAIPERILNYRISATTPTDELLTLRDIYSDLGRYASTILDREYITLSKKCATRLTKVEKQLSSRQSLLSAEEENGSVLPEMKESKAIPVDGMGGGVASMANITREIASTKILDSEVLSALTIDELYNLYCGWQQRHREREAEGREHMTFYFEGKIVKELQLRKPADKGEQLKIDYCAITYRNELENLAFIFPLPISSQLVSSLPTEVDKELTYPEGQEDMKARLIGNGYIYPESGREYTPSELLALIKLYSHYHDITERELLIEYVDIALNLMATSTDKVSYMAIASELLEIGRKGIITIPGWATLFLEEAVKEAKGNIKAKVKELSSTDRSFESELVLSLLTLQMQNGSQKFECEARRIVNHCYRRAIASEGSVDNLVKDLYTAVTCCDYVSRFSVRKIGESWNRLASQIISPSTTELMQLLTVANEIGDFARISVERKAILTEMLKHRALSGDFEAKVYLKTLSIPIATVA